MKATKGNKVYTIDESQKKHYQESGYDILDDDGTVIAYGKGKTVPFEEYQKVLRELETLKAGEEPVEEPVKKTTGAKTGKKAEEKTE